MEFNLNTVLAFEGERHASYYVTLRIIFCQSGRVSLMFGAGVQAVFPARSELFANNLCCMYPSGGLLEINGKGLLSWSGKKHENILGLQFTS